jgi:anhydro-N-acetylmuramic acid kinase
MDTNGSVSSSGQVDQALLEHLLSAVEPVLGQSLARETFSVDWLVSLVPDQVKTADAARTLIELTVTLIARAIRENSSLATEIFVAGGGAHNPVMMDALSRHLPDLGVSAFENLGMPGDAREAACFACLGWLYLRGESGANPQVTGAKEPKILGSLALP